MALICSLFWLVLLIALPLPKISAVALIIGVYSLHNRINGRKEAGHQCTASGGPEPRNKLLVASDHEHSWQKLMQHLRVKKD